MKTHPHSMAKNGDIVAVQGTHGTRGYIKIIDPKAQGTPSEGGHDCRDATPAEVKEASDKGTLKYGG